MRGSIRSQWRRFVPRSETLMVIAAIASAVAAAISALAAFGQEAAIRQTAARQEEATFTSILYNKQVDVLSNALTQAEKMYLLTFRISNAWTTDDDAPQKIAAASRDANELYEEWLAAFGSAILVVPSQVHDGLASISEQIRPYTIVLGNAKAALDSNKPFGPIKEYLHTDFTPLSPSLLTEINRVSGCLIAQFGKGQPLNGEDFDTCRK
jgi:hypothetical protein